MKWFVLLFCVFCTYSVTASNPDPAPGENVAEILEAGTYAISVQHDPPSYPTRARRAGIEGWVIVGFEIGVDGKTNDLKVVKTSIDGYFDAAAIDAASAWTYKPATFNGEPVDRTYKRVRIIFSMLNSDGGVSGKFKNEYEKAASAIGAGDLVTAKNHIDKLESSKRRLLAEVCYLDMLKSKYWASMGEDHKALTYVKRALVIADHVASNEIYINLLRRAIVGHAKSNDPGAALKNYNELLDADKNLDPDDPVHNLATKLTQMLEGDDPILASGEIFNACANCRSQEPFWYHELNRNRFSIDQVVGEVDEVEILCGYHSVSVGYQPDVIWTVNKDWEECAVRVSGEKGTTFRLVEHQNET